MKKFAILTILLVFSSVFYYMFIKKENQSIDFEQYNSLKRADNSFYLVIEKKECKDCKELNAILPKDKSIYKVDLSNEVTKEKWSQFISEQKIEYVPSVFLIKNNHVEKLEGEGNAKKLLMNYQKQNKENK